MGVRTLVILSIVFSVILFSSSNISYAYLETGKNNEIQINESTTRPTFGLSHENNKKIIEGGFVFNNQTFSITDNFHTPFKEQPISVGEVNSFEAKVFAEKKLKVQEFLFGIPNKGEAHLAELGVEVWYDLFGEIQKVNVVQKSKVIDSDSIIVTHEKTNCTKRDSEKNCDSTYLSMVFLEPLQDKIMAIKAIDYKNRYQITYLNDGFDVSGQSLNSMPIVNIPSPVRNEGLIQLTQAEKYSPYWTANDGRIFEKNNFGSFKQINHSFERFQDTGDARNRNHSEFGGILAYEQQRAIEIFDSSQIISELPESIGTPFEEPRERITSEIKAKMLEIEQECLEYLKESNRQTRNH